MKHSNLLGIMLLLSILAIAAGGATAYPFMNYGHDAFWNETAEIPGLSSQWTGNTPTYTTAQFFNGTHSFNVTGTASINKTITKTDFNLTWFVYASTTSPGAGSFAFGARSTSSYCGSDGQGIHLGYNQGTSAGNWVKCTGGTWSALTTPVAITVGWHAMELRIRGTSYTAYIDGTLVQSGTDANIGNYLDAFDTTGKFYIDDAHAWNGTAPNASDPVTSNFTIGVNNTRTSSLISGFSWNFTTTNASDYNVKSGYCSGTTCSITNFTGTLNVTVFNVSGGTFFNPYDSPKLSFVYNSSQSSYTFSTFQNSLQANLTNIVNGSKINNFCVQVSNSSTSQSNCTTNGLLTFYGVSGTTTLLYYNISNGSASGLFFNVTHVIGAFNSTLTNFTNSTYQSLLNLTAKQLYTLLNIQTFNITNWLLSNQTSAGQLFIRGNAGANNLKIDVPGNYSLNTTCNGTAVSTVSCTIAGIYDDIFKINATDALSAAPVTTFTVQASNSTLGGNVVNQSTTNGSAFIPVLQGYMWNFFIDATGYAYANATQSANASTNFKQFTLLPTNSIFLYFFDEETLADILQNVTVTFQNDSAVLTNSSTSGEMIASNLVPGTWTITASAPSYEQRSYFVTVTSRTTQDLDIYLLNSSSSNTGVFQIKDGTQGNPITTATVTMQQKVGSNWVTVGQLDTDAFGKVVFELVNDKAYQYIIEADGYTTKTGLFTFLSADSPYTILLDAANTQNFISYADDFSYSLSPTSVSRGVTNFSITTSSPSGAINWFAVKVSVNGSTTVQNVTSSPSGGTATVTLDLTPYNRQTVTATYYVKSAHFTAPLAVTRSWYVNEVTQGNYTFNDWVEYYGAQENPEDDKLGDMTRAIIVTIVAVIAAVAAGFYFGMEAALIAASLIYVIAAIKDWMNPGVTVVVVGLLVGTLMIGGRR